MRISGSKHSQIDLPAGLTHIGWNAFTGVEHLQYIDLPESLQVIGGGAFAACYNLKSIAIPGNVREILQSTFAYCLELETIVFSEGVETIASDAFRGDALDVRDKLANVSIPSSMTRIDACVFRGTPWLMGQQEEFFIVGDGVLLKYSGSKQHVIIPDGVKYISDAFAVNEDRSNDTIVRVTLPDSVRVIGAYAFSNCKELVLVDVQNGLTEIGNIAFWGSDNISKIILPPTVTDIGYHGFGNLYGSNLQKIYFQGKPPRTRWSFPYFTVLYYPMSLTEFWAPFGETWITYNMGNGNSMSYAIAPYDNSVPSPRYGDANEDGEITAADAACVLRYLAGLCEVSEHGLMNAKVSANPELAAEDAALILRFLTDLIFYFPAEIK